MARDPAPDDGLRHEADERRADHAAAGVGPVTAADEHDPGDAPGPDALDPQGRPLEEQGRRWPLLVVAVVALVGIGWFAFDAFAESTRPHHAPADVLADAPEGSFRLAGRVEDGSVGRDAERGVSTFVVAEDGASVTVEHDGRLPESLTGGADAVAEGELRDDGVFEADTVLAECASRFEEELEP